MTADALRVHDFLVHILEAIERIKKYTHDLTEQEFYSNSLVQDAVVRNFEIMGEASRNIERRGKDIPAVSEQLALFRQVYWMRNILAHNYFELNLTIVWNAIQKDLGNLETQIQQTYDKLIK